MVKKCTKSLCLILMLVMMALTFCACAQIRATLTSNLDGSIDEIVEVTIDTDEIINAGLSPIEVRQDIKEKALQTVIMFKSKMEEKCNNDLLTETDEDRIFMLKSFRVDGISILGGERWDGKTLTVGIRFKNIEAYRYFFEIPEDSVSEDFVEHHFFYDKIYYYSRNLYSIYKDATFYSQLKAHFESYPDELVNSASNEMLYWFVTDSKRQHSDADYVSYIDGAYRHTWIITDENIDEPVMFYYNVANAENWLLLAVGISLGVCVVLFGVNAIIEYSKKKKE